MTANNGNVEADLRQRLQAVDERYRHAEYERRQYRELAAELGIDLEDADSPSFHAGELIDEYPSRRPYVIEGLLRRGEIMNIIAAPKAGKSWLVYSLILSIAEGRSWLGFDTEEMPVLLIDNELHREELAYRLREVAFAMQIDIDKSSLIVEALRGQQADINAVERRLAARYKPGDFGLMVVDSQYRMIPAGTPENDNNAMTGIYNQLDAVADNLSTSIALIHHASKGNQSQKSITDVGAGAGAMTRATDTHLIIRPHEQPELAVIDAVTRSSKQPKSFSASFDWPTWSVDETEPSLKQQKTRNDSKKAADDAKGKKLVMDVLGDSRDWMIRSAVRVKTGMNADKCNRLIRELLDEDSIESKEGPNPRNGNTTSDYFRCTSDTVQLTARGVHVRHKHRGHHRSVRRLIGTRQPAPRPPMKIPAKLPDSAITALIDTREKKPLNLLGLQVEPATLAAGDYSVKGLEKQLAIERKSLPDLLACCGRERKRFDRKVQRLLAYPVRSLVIEADWSDIEAGRWRSQLTPKQVGASLISWQVRGLSIFMAGDHGSAGRIVSSMLRRAAVYRWRELRLFAKGIEPN